MHAEGFIGVPAGRLYYRISGFGPPLVLIGGGEAGCDMTERLQCELLHAFRVITFDRLGLSRSVSDPDGVVLRQDQRGGERQFLHAVAADLVAGPEGQFQ